MTKEFKNISIRGRLAYGMACLEKLTEHLSSDNPLLKAFVFPKIWAFTSATKLDDWETEINNVDPPCILDAKANFDDFPSIDKETFNKLKILYQTLPPDITAAISNVIEIGTANIYGDTEGNSPLTLKPLSRVINLMQKNNLSLPDIKTFKKSEFSESHGWGNEKPRDYYLT